MKTVETMIIESILLDSCFGSNPKLAKEYGTCEVTIDFQRNGNGKELVDFISYDARKDVFRCYEIKVSMSDFKSKAKKSWYGDYNYLVITNELYKQQSLDDWKSQIPDGIGIIVVHCESYWKETVWKAKKRDVDQIVKDMLLKSMLRSLFYQNVNSAFYLRDMRAATADAETALQNTAVGGGTTSDRLDILSGDRW